MKIDIRPLTWWISFLVYGYPQCRRITLVAYHGIAKASIIWVRNIRPAKSFAR